MNASYILIAEDDADDRFLIQTAFEERGYNSKIEFVENGVDLLAYLQNISKTETDDQLFPSFIMMDLNMPKKDGREVLTEIKQHPILKKIPVIVFTTTSSDMEVQRCYELGANSYIVKPGSFEELLTVIENIKNYWFNIVSIPG